MIPYSIKGLSTRGQELEIVIVQGQGERDQGTTHMTKRGNFECCAVSENGPDVRTTELGGAGKGGLETSGCERTRSTEVSANRRHRKKRGCAKSSQSVTVPTLV